MKNRERYLKNQEITKARAIYAIFKTQKARFIEDLRKADQKKVSKNITWERKATPDDIIDPFIKETAPEVPEYLITALPKIMEEGAKGEIKRYKDLLPEGYTLSFNIETSPASKYLKDLYDLHLSQKNGSINRTTRDRLREIMQQWVENGDSYTQIADQIEAEDPWLFGKERAKLIAINEIGRAYGWANHEPAVELQREGYVMEKKWATSNDDKVRKTHKQNQQDGWIPLNKEFSGTKDQFGPSTNEIRCRCTSTHRIIGINDGKTFHQIEKGTPAEDIKKKHFAINQNKV